MAIPTRAELNGRILYSVIAENKHQGTVYALYVGTDETEAARRARRTPGAVVLAGQIHYDAREIGQE